MISDINSSGFLMMIMSNCGTIAAGHYLTRHNRCQWFRFECLTQTLKLNLCDFEKKPNRQSTRLKISCVELRFIQTYRTTASSALDELVNYVDGYT